MLSLSLCFFKLPGYGVLINFFIANPWTGSFAYTFSVVLTIYQYLGQTLIAFNRFTCVWMPILHKKIWSTKWYIPVIIILPILSVSHRFTAAGIYGLNRDGTINVGYVDKNFETFGLNVAAIIYGINTFISIALAILTIIKHLRLGNSTTLISTDICVKLLVYSLLLLFVQIIRLTYNRMRSIFINNDFVISIIIVMLQYIVDIHAAVASFGILILSPTTRKSYIKFYCRFIRIYILRRKLELPRTARIAPILKNYSNTPTI
uniref:Serpentine receptor class gamma n=1 Tax=Panagrolaimus sp. PS1159 TaxID=55785 RepID=A0AC35GTL5_9BILA